MGDRLLGNSNLLTEFRSLSEPCLKPRFLARFIFSFLLLALTLLPGAVWAQGATAIGAVDGTVVYSATGNSFGDIMCKFKSQSSSLPNFFGWLAYIGGVFFVARFLMLLKDHWENPQQVKLHRPLLHGLAGSMLLALPGAVGMMVDTLYGVGVGGANACTAVVGAVAPGGLDVLAQNFVTNIKRPVLIVGTWVCYFMGVFFIWRGIDKMARYGTDPNAYSTTKILSSLVFGTILVGLARAKDVIMQTIWAAGTTVDGSSAVGNGIGLGYANQNGGGGGLIDWVGLGILGPTAQFDNAYMAATTFMQLVGFIAFLRGWFICKRAVEGTGSATIGQGLTHIIGGALCMNLILFLKAAQTTFNIPNFLL